MPVIQEMVLDLINKQLKLFSYRETQITSGSSSGAVYVSALQWTTLF